MQETRLQRIEAEAAKLEAKYRERDETLRNALLELGKELAAIGGNVARELANIRRSLKAAHARISDLAAKL